MSTETLEIMVDASGEVRGIYSDELADLLAAAGHNTPQVKRASHVEPHPDGGWQADMTPVGGPVFGPYQHRREALDQELDWLQLHWLSCDAGGQAATAPLPVALVPVNPEKSL